MIPGDLKLRQKIGVRKPLSTSAKIYVFFWGGGLSLLLAADISVSGLSDQMFFLL